MTPSIPTGISNTNVLIVEGRLLLLTNVPIQNRAKQLQIYEVFNLPIPHSNLSAQYKIDHSYIGVIYEETKAVSIMNQQYIACQHKTVLQNKCTLPTSHKPTIMNNCPVY